MKKRLYRYFLPLAVIGLAAAAIYFFYYHRPLLVEVVRPATNVPVKVFGLGTVEARVLSSIGFEVGGALDELNVDHGNRVQRGDILARVDSAEQKARVAKSRAGVVNAQAALKRAQAAVGKAHAVLAQKQQINERKQALLKKQTVSTEVAEQAQMEQEVAAADLAVATSDVEVAQAALEDAGAQHAYEKVLLEQYTLKAPYDAVVVRRHKELGVVLVPGEPLFTLVDPDTVWVLAYIDEARAGNIRLGQTADVRLRSLPRQLFQGHVSRVDIESDRVSEERRVYVACDRCPKHFHLGEQAEVLITTTVLDEALLVPEVAVEKFDAAGGVVWTVEQGKLQRRKVTFGQRTLDSRLEIVAGLPADAYILKALPPGLREGRSAMVVTEDVSP